MNEPVKNSPRRTPKRAAASRRGLVDDVTIGARSDLAAEASLESCRPTTAFRESLLAWYDRQHRDLPWRHAKDPYAIWVSEIMLQQTRVEAVIPYYHRFLSRFPDVTSLADSSEEEVLAHWSGLGYYSRARNLHRGASLVRERFGGEFPRSRAEALTIPGIGRYTSAAVLSIAYGEAHAVVDGNVARVLTRLFGLEAPEDTARKLEMRAQELLDTRRPGDHNQAMMELGATVCTPQVPRCPICPLERLCSARAQNRTHQLPRVQRARETERIEAVVLLLGDAQERILLERGRWRLLPHLWLPPIVEVANADALEPDEAFSQWIDSGGPNAGAARDLRWMGSFTHSITHHRLRFRVLHGVVPAVATRKQKHSARPAMAHRWVHPEDLGSVGVSSILIKALRHHEAHRTKSPRASAP